MKHKTDIMKKWGWMLCCLFAGLNVYAQSAWKKVPEEAEVLCKILRNTFRTYIYNEELQIERVNVVNNRMLQIQLRCPLHSLEYRSEVGVAKRSMKNGRHEEFAIMKTEEPLFFLPDERIQLGIDLSMFNQNGEYCFLLKLHTELNETYFVRVFLNTEEFEESRNFEMMPTEGFNYEEEQADEDYVYSFIENMAEFPGGKDAMLRFIQQNIDKTNLPADLNNYINWTEVGMVIDKDGTVLYPEIIHYSHEGLNDEAMRLLKMMPRWKPGSINGKKVKCRQTFRLVLKGNMPFYPAYR